MVGRYRETRRHCSMQDGAVPSSSCRRSFTIIQTVSVTRDWQFHRVSPQFIQSTGPAGGLGESVTWVSIGMEASFVTSHVSEGCGCGDHPDREPVSGGATLGLENKGAGLWET